jgi:predicted adenine nucleotide alpha hydrolase (AANH) superfamily ATPase
MKPKLLLDVCCGPCSTHVIEEMKKKYDIALFFPNSNIYPKEEYTLRFENAMKVANNHKLKLISSCYDHKDWLLFVKGLEDEPERGKRCEKCFEYRFDKTANYCSDNGYNAFTTTLTVSPFKDHDKINKIGKKIGAKYDIEFLECNFKKSEGYNKSKKYSIDLGLYRQNYCGCEFSMRK